VDHLEAPSPELWNKRKLWFESIEKQNRNPLGSYILSEQACALTAEVQATFCAGAWAGTIILVMAVVDASLREVEVPGFKGDSKKLIQEAKANPKLQILRKRRNALVHINSDQPALTVDQQWSDRDKLELEAREAVKLMFEAFYMTPGT
jgi:glycine/serine hydroxymethyltransferase